MCHCCPFRKFIGCVHQHHAVTPAAHHHHPRAHHHCTAHHFPAAGANKKDKEALHHKEAEGELDRRRARKISGSSETVTTHSLNSYIQLQPRLEEDREIHRYKDRDTDTKSRTKILPEASKKQQWRANPSSSTETQVFSTACTQINSW